MLEKKLEKALDSTQTKRFETNLLKRKVIISAHAEQRLVSSGQSAKVGGKRGNLVVGQVAIGAVAS